MGSTITALVIVLAALLATPVAAQQVDITAPAPERAREPVLLPPGDHYRATRPSDADYYPETPRVRHDPTFIGPLSSKTEGPGGPGRMGVAGWTSPNTPVGAAQTGRREVTGWFALGFAFEWGGPPPAKRPAR